MEFLNGTNIHIFSNYLVQKVGKCYGNLLITQRDRRRRYWASSEHTEIWSNGNGMKFSSTKCNTLHLGANNMNQQYDIAI